MKWSFLLGWIVCCWACSHENTAEYQVFHVNPESESKECFDHFYHLKEVIPLETTDSSVMGDIMKVISAKGRIFVAPWNGKSIFIFDRSGKYLSRIDKEGRGPGEYLKISDFMVTEEPEEIVVYAREGKLNFYDWDGNFLRDSKQDAFVGGIERLPDGSCVLNYVLSLNSLFRDTAFMVRVTDPDGKCVKGFFPLPKIRVVLPVKMVTSLYQSGGRCYIAPITENTIYEYVPEKMEFMPRYEFDVKGVLLPEVEKLTFEDFRRNFIFDYYIFSSEYVGKRTVLTTAFCGRKGEMIYFVGKVGEPDAYVLRALYDETNELPLNRYMQHSGFEGNLVLYNMPLQIKEQDFKVGTSAGYKLSRQLGDEDNPVLFVYEEK